jgi:hypothetical protein
MWPAHQVSGEGKATKVTCTHVLKPTAAREYWACLPLLLCVAALLLDRRLLGECRKLLLLLFELRAHLLEPDRPSARSATHCAQQ